jgi:hypothetical protein
VGCGADGSVGRRLNVPSGHCESKANALVDEGRFCDRSNLKGVAQEVRRTQEDFVDGVRQVEMLLAAMVMPGTVPGRWWRRQANRAYGGDAQVLVEVLPVPVVIAQDCAIQVGTEALVSLRMGVRRSVVGSGQVAFEAN